MSWLERVGQPAPTPEAVLEEIRRTRLFRGVPRFFELLYAQPAVLHVVWEGYRTVSENAVLPASRKLLMGLVVADGVPSEALAKMQLAALASAKVSTKTVRAVRKYLGGPGVTPHERTSLEFAKESVDYSESGLAGRTRALRAAGLSDAEIVETVATAAFYNQVARMANLLGA